MREPRKASKRASKRTPAPNGTGRRSKKADEQRRRGIALLTEWSEKGIPLQFVSGNSSLKVMGHLVRMQLSPDQDDFMFKTPFGIVATVFPLIYDDIHVDELLPSRPVVFLNMSGFPNDGLRLEAHPEYEPSAEMTKAAEDVFDSWINEGARLVVSTADIMRVSFSVCEMTKAGDGAFMLADRQAKAVHVLFPRRSGIIEIDQCETGAEVTLHNRSTNSYIAIRKAPEGAEESPEELLAKYPIANRFVH